MSSFLPASPWRSQTRRLHNQQISEQPDIESMWTRNQ